ncbi:hypothetical protein TNCV_876791 [Trichonephila clavipes]|nr:hypothetical protein TNCV_876791 [Trichonephila clavipes]
MFDKLSAGGVGPTSLLVNEFITLTLSISQNTKNSPEGHIRSLHEIDRHLRIVSGRKVQARVSSFSIDRVSKLQDSSQTDLCCLGERC